MSRAREWAIRAGLESNQHERTAWTTLTYEDEKVPLTLRKDHLQTWLKDLRERIRTDQMKKTCSKRKACALCRHGLSHIKFFASGEYGEQRKRAHYHAILYGVDTTAPIQDHWPYGHAHVVELTPARIAYTAGYTAKKIGWHNDLGERVDETTGEVYDYQPPFIQMSRRPGLAANARQYWQSWRDTARHNGANAPVPRYLHEAWKAQASEMDKQLLTEEKKQRTQNNTLYHRLAQEQIDKKRHAMMGETRTL